jgi:hypothetical protein
LYFGNRLRMFRLAKRPRPHRLPRTKRTLGFSYPSRAITSLFLWPTTATYGYSTHQCSEVLEVSLNTCLLPRSRRGYGPRRQWGGFGYRCTVKNHGRQTAFGVSFSVTISKLNLIRSGNTWTTGEAKETHTVTVWIPLPLGQQGHDQFSFYVCSYDPDGALDVTLPSTAFINSDDPKTKREVSVKIASIARNPFTVPPKQPLPKQL